MKIYKFRMFRLMVINVLKYIRSCYYELFLIYVLGI